MYIAFNELSVNAQIRTSMSNMDAKQRINEFVELLHYLHSRGYIEGVITTVDIQNFILTKDYGIKEWLMDSSVNHNYKQFLRVLLSKRCSYVNAADVNSEFEICINDKKYCGVGCLFAAEGDGHVVSLFTNKHWKQKELLGKYITVNESGNLEYSESTITNLLKIDDASVVKNNIVKNVYKHISSGQDLWEQRKLLFPDLIFCESVKDQLYNDPEKFHIIRIIKKLQRIQEYFESYDGIYNPKVLGLDARTESETVKLSPQLRGMRLFRMPNGQEEYFFNHIGFNGKFSGGRIYFLPDDANRKCYIGYIGRHLATKKY